jgi:cysteine-rich repeat protein
MSTPFFFLVVPFALVLSLGSGCTFLFLTRCGDNIALEGREECDDGNQVDGDGCRADCTQELCGDSLLDPQEQCDDGNLVNALTAGDAYTCALLSTSNVRCWGNGGDGQLGYGNTNNIGDDETPEEAYALLPNNGDVNLDGEGEVLQLATGGFHTCALLSGGNVRCWGAGNSGQLGYGNLNIIGDDETPGEAYALLPNNGDVNLGGEVLQLTAGDNYTCALLSTSNVRCWGQGVFGQLGYGNTNNIGDNEIPEEAYALLPNNGDVNIGGRVLQIDAGFFHTCVLLDTGNVRCWGSGGSQLGYGNLNTIGDDETPGEAYALLPNNGDVNLGGEALQLAASNSGMCALLSGGNVRCWGFGFNGQLGYGNQNDVGDDETPASAGDVNVGGSVVQLTAGNSHTCALLSNGTVRCWGFGGNGQLGYGNINKIGDDETPASAGDVNVGDSVVQIVAGSSHTCALLSTGNVRCWGSGGNIGYGNTNNIGDDETPASTGDVPGF